MARKHTKSMKRRTHKARRHRGGGWGFTGPSSIPGTPGTVSNPQVFTGIGDCRAVKPGYDIPYSSYSASMKGLPGMSGGKRTRKQRGGRYGFFPEGDPNPSGQLYYAGSYAPIQRIGCEGGSFNPLNPTHTGSSAPPGAANPNYWMKGGKRSRKQRGGSQATTGQRGGAQLAPATYGVGNVDSMYYYAPTAGYANTASTWKDSVGAPVQIQVPYAAREMNQACLSTGGHPPLTGALQKGGKRSRKQRGGVSIWNLVQNAPNRARGALAGIPIIGDFFGRNNNNNGGPQPMNVNNNAANGGPQPMNVNNNAVAPPAPPNNVVMNAGPEPMNVNNNAVVPPAAPAVEPAAPPVQYNANGNVIMNAGPQQPIVMGGRKRHARHRKHKKMTHKRKH